MLRSKSRPGSFRLGQKNNSSVLTRSISASKFCRGDALTSQVDTNALVSVDQKPSNVANLSENRIDRAMQRQMGQLEEDLERTKEQLGTIQKERDRALDELLEMKQVAHEANMRLNEALSLRKAREVSGELKAVKELLSISQEELEVREMKIESFKVELANVKLLELILAERDASIDRMDEELSKVKSSENHALAFLSESKKKIQELESEIERGKLSESKMLDSVAAQTNLLEQRNIELEESKLEIASLLEKIEKLEISSSHSSRGLNGHNNSENLTCAQEGEKIASLKAKSPLDEIGLLKNELKLATEAEEKSKKAMDDLALALTEVATEANQAKEKLSSTQVELEHVKGESQQLKVMVRSTEDKYKKLLDEAKKDSELYRNTADRLRLEAEESLLAWNGKEMGFVSCIKRADEERAVAQRENARLVESLKAAENMTRAAKEENYKLRDILKQALNESNVAKEAASIARAENSDLKDCIAEKDEALHLLTQENEHLRISETAAHENVMELKRLLSTSSTELKTKNKDQRGMFKSRNSTIEKREEDNKLKKTFSFNLSELKILNEHEDVNGTVVDEDPEKAEALKGSIFDNAVSPKSELRIPKSGPHHRRRSSVFTDEGDTPNSEDLDHLNGTHFEDSDERNSSRRSRALLRKFSDLITRKSLHKKDSSME
ncbi:unnamed protein product [Ilex paraguariensis]|uniref:Uncharacterized protein n=1 Tax=Ilex paraguariensis TaxID=185542 RepID=A0ABC8TMZ8_9AQUA